MARRHRYRRNTTNTIANNLTQKHRIRGPYRTFKNQTFKCGTIIITHQPQRKNILIRCTDSQIHFKLLALIIFAFAQFVQHVPNIQIHSMIWQMGGIVMSNSNARRTNIFVCGQPIEFARIQPMLFIIHYVWNRICACRLGGWRRVRVWIEVIVSKLPFYKFELNHVLFARMSV